MIIIVLRDTLEDRGNDGEDHFMMMCMKMGIMMMSMMMIMSMSIMIFMMMLMIMIMIIIIIMIPNIIYLVIMNIKKNGIKLILI